jgi:hypothetical protein
MGNGFANITRQGVGVGVGHSAKVPPTPEVKPQLGLVGEGVGV